MENDETPIHLYDEGWDTITAFDYSKAGIDASMGAILDKGTLDAIYITGVDAFQQAVQEFARVSKTDAILVCVSNVIPSDLFLQTFDSGNLEAIHNGELAFAPDGEATVDLGANLYSWRRL